MGMRSLVSNIVTEDYVIYAELAGVERRRILGSYVMRNALVPQVTGLAMSLGAIFNGAIITEQVFGYPGVGTLLVDAVHAGDYSLVLGITTVSILAVSAAVLLIDLALSAARSAREGALMAGACSATCCATTANSPSGVVCCRSSLAVAVPVLLLALSAERQLRRAARRAAVVGLSGSARPRAARTCSGSSPSRSATPCCSASSVAVLSRLLSLLIGPDRRATPAAGSTGVLMSINDTFIVIPLFPILVLFYFVLKDHMSWGLLALMMACLGWAYDARLIRSVALSLRYARVHRDRHLLRHEHAADPGRGAPALRPADRVLDHHEQHQLVDRARGHAVGAGLHRHQHADHRRA